MARTITAAFPPVPREADAARVRTGVVTVKALAGTRILGLGPEALEVGADGTARVGLTRPGFYTVEARRPAA